jgi:DNA-binding transcriptional MerR regulator
VADYRVDELARETATTVYNIRLYIHRGLLPPPRRDGQIAWYSDDHLHRLRLINRLLDRGYDCATIGNLLATWSAGHDLAEVLGLDEVVNLPWTDEAPTYLPVKEVERHFGGAAAPEVIERAVALGLIERCGRTYRIISPRLYEAGEALRAAGMSGPEVLDLTEALQRDLDVVAERLVSVIANRVLCPDSPDLLPPPGKGAAAIASIQRLRPHAFRAVEALLARAMERGTDHLSRQILESAGPRPATTPGPYDYNNDRPPADACSVPWDGVAAAGVDIGVSLSRPVAGGTNAPSRPGWCGYR